VRLRILVAAALLAALASLGTLTIGVSVASGGLQTIGHRTGPVVASTSNLYFALADMDAQVANVLLVAHQDNLGVTRELATQNYERRRAEVSQYLQATAAIAGADPAAGTDLRALFDGLGKYESLATEAMVTGDDPAAAPGRPPTRALFTFGQATELMHLDVLPAAQDLSATNNRVLTASYDQSRASVLRAFIWSAIFGAIAIVILIGAQVYFARRHHRFLNLGLLGATLTVGVLVALGLGVLSSESGQLRVAKNDAFNSIYALSQARAVSYDANADESRYLLDPYLAVHYEQVFMEKSQQLATFPRVGINQYDSALNRALKAYQANHGDVGFTGFLGDELRNITFPTEDDAAYRAIAAYHEYQVADRHLRDLASRGRLDEAIRFCTSSAQGNSNYAFEQYDKALTAIISINQKAFYGAIRTGEQQLGGWGVIPGIGALLAIALLLMGIRPRMAEYR
jgi:hypothetical protein